MTEQSSEPGSTNALPSGSGAASVADDGGAAQAHASPGPVLPERRRAVRRRRLLMGALGVAVLAIASVFLIPWIRLALDTVSTDDAFVNGHVTFVAARVRGQVSRVLVDDNNRVHQGDLLVQLDKEPFQNAVAVKRAAVDTAKAELRVATATVRGIEAEARGRRWKLQRAIEDVGNQIALLRARVAALDKAKAALTLAQIDFERGSRLVVTDAVTRQEFDRRQAILLETRAAVTQARADVHQIRAALGLTPQPEAGADLAQVPPDLDETFSSVRQAQADLIESAAQLGIIHSDDETPKRMVEQFERSGVDQTFARLAREAPAVKQAEAKLEAANRDLTQAELDLRYCDVFAEIDGVVTRRNVNPGNNVQVGEGLMAIRSLREVWVDANFKETQLRDLRIGQAVDLYLDMYGDRHVFKGRVSGFTMGTGSTLALLPAQNATGNYIKVVQRLPVRIELEDHDPDKNPLFIGTSVVPYVYLNKPAAGPDAGKFLQAYLPPSPGSRLNAGQPDPVK